MTTTTTAAPRFETPNHRHGLRAVVIAALCAALGAGFAASTWRVSSPAAGADDVRATAAACAIEGVRAC